MDILDDRAIVHRFDHITGGCNNSRLSRFKAAMLAFDLPHQAFELHEVQDEHTGKRYGERDKRRGWAVKIGGGGRNKGSRYAYQVWAVVKNDFRKRRGGDKQ